MSEALEVAVAAADEETAADAYDRLRTQCRSEASPTGTTLPASGGTLTSVEDLDGVAAGTRGFVVIRRTTSESGEPAVQVTHIVQRADRLVLLDVGRDYSDVDSIDVPAFRAATLQILDRISA
jgi:hypothetical protein